MSIFKSIKTWLEDIFKLIFYKKQIQKGATQQISFSTFFFLLNLSQVSL